MNKAVLSVQAFSNALSLIKQVATMRSTLPILSCVKLELGEGALRLSGTNLDTTLALQVTAEVAGTGALCVPCGKLAAAIGRMDAPDAEVEVRFEKSGLVCRSGPMTLKLLGLDPEEFPTITEMPEATPAIEIESKEIAAAIRNALLFASDDESRYVLCGLFFTSKEDGRLRIIATDGRRLFVRKFELEADCNGIVPVEAARMLPSLAAFSSHAVAMRFAGDRFEAKGEGWQLVSKLIDGQFPNIDQVIPPGDSCERGFTLDHAELDHALRFAATVLLEKGGPVKVVAGKNQVSITASQADVGEASVELKGETEQETEVCYNALFLGQALQAVDGSEMTLRMHDAQSPTLIENGNSTVVLMPMRNSGAA
jgi:DNA polymerase-3 subunit beta